MTARDLAELTALYLFMYGLLTHAGYGAVQGWPMTNQLIGGAILHATRSSG